MKIFTSIKHALRVALHVILVRPFVRLVFGVNATGTEQLKPLDQYIIIANHNSDHFPGNPRISFQHQATRLRGDRQALRRARSWAVWALIREAKPTLPGDATQDIEEPTLENIEAELQAIGHPNEVALWQAALAD